MSFQAVLQCCLLLAVVAVIVPIVFRTLWLRILCVALILLASALAAFQLWFAGALVVSRFQHGIKPGTNASYGQFYIQDCIYATLPIFVVSIVGLSVLVFVPLRKSPVLA